MWFNTIIINNNSDITFDYYLLWLCDPFYFYESGGIYQRRGSESSFNWPVFPSCYYSPGHTAAELLLTPLLSSFPRLQTSEATAGLWTQHCAGPLCCHSKHNIELQRRKCTIMCAWKTIIWMMNDGNWSLWYDSSVIYCNCTFSLLVQYAEHKVRLYSWRNYTFIVFLLFSHISSVAACFLLLCMI